MINIEINNRNRGIVYGFWIRPVSRLRDTSLSLRYLVFWEKRDVLLSLDTGLIQNQ